MLGRHKKTNFLLIIVLVHNKRNSVFICISLLLINCLEVFIPPLNPSSIGRRVLKKLYCSASARATTPRSHSKLCR